MKRNYVIGLITATAVGVVAGILLAPAKGKELRERIRDKGQDLAKKVRSSLQNESESWSKSERELSEV